MTPRRRRKLDLHRRIAVFRRDAYRCSHCGFVGTWATLEVDHVVPFSWDGNDDPAGMQTLCLPCNRSKGARYAG